MSAKRQIRCAVYTRKSTEEGLEQDFNSLDAQREACAAYIISQKAEGWVALQEHYDDGGYSGGTLERPALKMLLAAIERRAVDVVVVYKIDRLSRSLMDFAKLVEVFDRNGVTFVSVTQSFNTTTSMGRLTLNVLLSFAQFEREVTGERIRDKFAASKKKGIWMGGNPPLGYDVRERKLVINPMEADWIRLLFQRYLELGCVRLLCADAAEQGIVSKLRRSSDGRHRGGKPIGRSALYQILNNRTYTGQLPHKGVWYRGEQDPIVPLELFEKVQARLAEMRPPISGRSRMINDAPYIGILIDEAGVPMVPTYTAKRSGLRYRYYASRTVLKSIRSDAAITRVPAPTLESLLGSVWSRLGLITDPSAVPKSIKSIQLLAQSIRIRMDIDTATSFPGRSGPVDTQRALQSLRTRLLPDETLEVESDEFVLILPVRAKFRGGTASVAYSLDIATAPGPDLTLIKAVARAHRYRQMLVSGAATSIEALASHLGQDRGYIGQILKLAFLSPDLTRATLRGEHPPAMRLARLLETDIPMSWKQQREMFKPNVPDGLGLTHF